MAEVQHERVDPGEKAGRNHQWKDMFTLAALSFAILFPNLLLFSTDDLDVYRKSGEAGIAISQAGIGRYTFHLVGLAFRTLGADYNSYLIVATALFSASLAALFRVAMAILGLEISGGTLLGYAIFLTFGLNLDLFQYQFAYMQYGVAFLCAGGVLWLVHRPRHRLSAIAAASVLGAVGFGAYQLFAHLVLMTTLALGLSACIDERIDHPRRLRVTILSSLLALSIAAVLYLAINAGLKAFGVADFARYPVRAQGLSFARTNLPAYGRTLLDLLDAARPQYRPLLPKVWLLLSAGSMLTGAATLWRRGPRFGVPGMVIIVIALVAWPNPANLFLADYWPSARSMAGFGIFLGIVCGVLFRRVEVDRASAQFGSAALVGLLACQCILMAIRYQDRLVQQTVDVALAQAILLHADGEFSVGEPVAIDLAVAPGATQTVKPLVYDYGRSMFATAWSAPALLDYLSGHRASVRVVSTGDCDAGAGRLSYARRGDRLLVCLLDSRR